MRPRLLIFVLAMLFALLAAAPAQAETADSSYYFVPLKSRAALRLLQDAGLSVLWRLRTGVWLKLNEAEVKQVLSLGFTPRYWPRSPLAETSGRKTPNYHDNDGVKAVLDQIAASYPAISRRFTLGRSVQERDLHGLIISKNPAQDEPEPRIRLVGSHHGDEYMSVEVPLLMAQYLTSQYAADARVKALVDGNTFVVVPLLNPDGHALEQRRNANGVDLNRVYGYEYQNSARFGDDSTSVFSPFSQPEVRALADDHFAHNYTQGYTFHTFGDVVNYTWNYTTQPCPDEPLIKTLSQRYGSHNGYRVTEGFDWFQTYGDLNDFSYGVSGTFDTTIELVAEDPVSSWLPKEQTISEVWDENREALLDAFEQTAKGISGLARDRATGWPLRAYVLCDEIFWPVYTEPKTGYFMRLLAPGTYTCKVVAPGYATVSLGAKHVADDNPLHLGEILLTPTPAASHYAFQLMTVSTDGENTSYTPALLGAADGRAFSLFRQGGLVVVDMGSSLALDDAHALRVSLSAQTGGATYILYLGNDYSGPWTSLGEGRGTQDFALTGLGLASARYVKIMAASHGSGTEYAAVDAVEYRHLDSPSDGDAEAEREAEPDEAESKANENDAEPEAEEIADADGDGEAPWESEEGQGEAESALSDGDLERSGGDADFEFDGLVPYQVASDGGCATASSGPGGWVLLLFGVFCWRKRRRA